MCSTASIFNCPYTSTWPHLTCVVGLEEREYWKNWTVFLLQYCVLLLILLGLVLCLPSASVSSLFIVLCVYVLKKICLHPSLYLLLSWVWWLWHGPSVLWHCWLGHLTRKIISVMTCNVTSVTLNPTIPILSLTGFLYCILSPDFEAFDVTKLEQIEVVWSGLRRIVNILIFQVFVTHPVCICAAYIWALMSSVSNNLKWYEVELIRGPFKMCLVVKYVC